MSSAIHIDSNEQIEGLTVTVKDLNKRFNREWIFKNFSYTFRSGTTYAITGPNGSGKSTLLQVLWGQVPQTSGSLQYSINKNIIDIENICSYISIATPYLDLIDDFTLNEQLNFHFKLKQIRSSVSINELMEIMYLKQAKDKYLGNFSSGMKQRVKLALAFYTQADLIFLDEPGTNLDDQAFAWYKNELQKLPIKSTVFIASNNSAEYPINATTINLMDFKIG